jgi:serine O-acetyltransferase
MVVESRSVVGVGVAPRSRLDDAMSSPDSSRERNGESNGNPEGIGLLGLVREDLAAHGGDRHAPGFRVLVVHRFGNWRMGVRPALLRAPMSIVYRRLHHRMVRQYGIELEYCVSVGRRVRIEHQSGIVVNGYCVIGDDCVIRQNTTMGIRGYDDLEGAPVLGRGVDVGAGASLIGRIHVGDGAVIGPNSVVTTDVAPGATVVGVPARPVSS